MFINKIIYKNLKLLLERIVMRILHSGAFLSIFSGHHASIFTLNIFF